MHLVSLRIHLFSHMQTVFDKHTTRDRRGRGRGGKEKNRAPGAFDIVVVVWILCYRLACAVRCVNYDARVVENDPSPTFAKKARL